MFRSMSVISNIIKRCYALVTCSHALRGNITLNTLCPGLRQCHYSTLSIEKRRLPRPVGVNEV